MHAIFTAIIIIVVNSLRFASPVSKESREQTPGFLQVSDGSHFPTGGGEMCITPAGSDPLLHPQPPSSEWRDHLIGGVREGGTQDI